MTLTISGFQFVGLVCGVAFVIGAAVAAMNKGEPDPFGWGRGPSVQSYVGCAFAFLALVVFGAVWLGSLL